MNVEISVGFQGWDKRGAHRRHAMRDEAIFAD
jgi:hypothetical protein